MTSIPTTTTDLFADPRELQDPLALKDPLALTPSEQQEFTRLSNQKDFSTLAKVGAALGAAFLLHRGIMARRIKSQIGAEPRVSSLRLIADASVQLLIPQWLSIVTPALLAGYRLGVKEANAGQIPEKDLYEIAELYAKELGQHYNEVSTEALLQGFQAQVNRKVPAARAARLAAEAYGVPPRAMNALVSIWNTEDPKVLSSLPLNSVRDIRAKTFIDAQLRNRAGQVAEAEAWSTKSQAKQIVWAYGVQKGIIPADARRVWVTARDEKVCKHCGPLHRKRVEIGETFETTLGKVWTPPLHVNCRCDVVLEYTGAPRMAVVKAQGDDPYNRDSHGHFARKESRQPKPQARPYAPPPTRIERLHEQVNAPSISEQISRQLQEFEQKQRAEEEAEKQRLQPKKLTSRQLTSRSLGERKLSTRSLAEPPAPKQLGEGKKLSERKLGARKLSIRPMSDTQQRKFRDKVFRMSEDAQDYIETSTGKWFRADSPMVAIIPGYETGPHKDFVMDAYNPAIELTERAYGGFDSFYEELDKYWSDEMSEMMDQFWASSGDVVYYDGETAYTITPDDFYEALEERVQGIPLSQSSPLRLEPDDGKGPPKSVTAFHLAEYLSLGDWVEEAMPDIVVINHINPETSEKLKGGRWRVPGKFKATLDQGPDLDLGHLPHRFYYAEPTD